MRDDTRIAHLTDLRNEIAALRIVKCRMMHEKFASRAPGLRLQRIGLCSPELRAERLGCSHTMSRVKLDDAIRELRPAVAEHLSDELNWLTNQIHLLDHRKGAAEALLAKETETAGVWQAGQEEPGERLVSEQLRDMEQEHDRYVERVGHIQEAVVAELDEMIQELMMVRY